MAVGVAVEDAVVAVGDVVVGAKTSTGAGEFEVSVFAAARCEPPACVDGASCDWPCEYDEN